MLDHARSRDERADEVGEERGDGRGRKGKTV